MPLGEEALSLECVFASWTGGKLAEASWRGGQSSRSGRSRGAEPARVVPQGVHAHRQATLAGPTIFQLRRRSPTRSGRGSRGASHKRIASEGAWRSQQQQQQPPPRPGAQGALTNLAPSEACASDWSCADGTWREERSQKLAQLLQYCRVRLPSLVQSPFRDHNSRSSINGSRQATVAKLADFEGR